MSAVLVRPSSHRPLDIKGQIISMSLMLGLMVFLSWSHLYMVWTEACIWAITQAASWRDVAACGQKGKVRRDEVRKRTEKETFRPGEGPGRGPPRSPAPQLWCPGLQPCLGIAPWLVTVHHNFSFYSLQG